MSNFRLSSRIRTAAVSASASGDNTIVTVPAGQRILVLGYVLVAAGTVSAKWKTGSTDLTGAMPFVANGGVSAIGVPEGPLFLTATAGDDLILNLSAAVLVAGHVSYIVAHIPAA